MSEPELNSRPHEDVYVPHCGWLRFPPGDNIARFLREGWCDHVELAFLWRLLRPGDRFLDGGAHAGLYSLLALQATAPGGQVVAIEPNPRVREYFEHNFCATLDRVHLYRAALGAAPGRARFSVGESHRTAFDHLSAAGDDPSCMAIDVELTTVDAILAQETGRDIVCAKLDLEGAEPAALEGAIAGAARIRCWLIEFTELNLRRFGSSTKGLLDAAHGAGLGLYRWDKVDGLVEVHEEGPIWYENLIGTRDPEWVRDRLRAAPPDRMRIAAEILARGEASRELQSGALHMSRDLAVGSARRARDEVQAARTRAAEAEARAQIALENLDEAYRRLAMIDGQLDRLSRQNAAANQRAHHSQMLAAKAMARWRTGAATHSNPGSDAGKISVVVCTYDPAPATLGWVLDSLDHQSLSPYQFEVVIVDNGSPSPVAAMDVLRGRGFSLRTVLEPRNGVLFARCAGIRAATYDLIVFVDDDNYLDPDYLSRAVRVAAENPSIGAFGGKAKLLCDRSFPSWMNQLMVYFGVRDYGDEVITSNENKWGPWEPIGAGMVFRRPLGEAFIATVARDPFARRIGRTKVSYICGEDSLLARLGYGLGFSCSYQPSLVLTHFIRASRLKPTIVAKTIAGIGRSYVLYETVLGTSSFEKTAATKMLLDLSVRALGRVRERGVKAGVLEWFWDIGYYKQIRECLS